MNKNLITTSGSRRVGRRSLRLVASACTTVVLLGAFSACGSDDEASREAAFCNAGDSLRTDIAAVGDIDILSEGTNGLNERFIAIETDLKELVDSGSDVAADEIEALDSAVSELGSALEALGDDVSVDGARAVGTALTNVTAAASATLDILSNTCS